MIVLTGGYRHLRAGATAGGQKGATAGGQEECYDVGSAVSAWVSIGNKVGSSKNAVLRPVRAS
jgi:hypothetical protein